MFPSGVIASSAMPNIGALSLGPIADIGTNSDFSPEEINLRNQLASLYRLVDLLKWSQSIYNHMTVRLSASDDEILINPFGRFYNEVTASSFVKVDLNGKVLHPGSTNLGINQAGYVLHSAVHAVRRDVICLIHLHTPSVAAVSAMKCGLLPICQESMIVGPVAYHDYQGILVDTTERASIVADLGDKNVMLLRNHGFLVCGRTVGEAFSRVYHLILACETQVKAMTCGGVEQLIIPTEEAAQRAYNIARNAGGGVNRLADGTTKLTGGIGELEWAAWMRAMDAMGLETGYQHPESQ